MTKTGMWLSVCSVALTLTASCDRLDQLAFAAQAAAPRLAVGDFHACLVKTNGKLVCWGANDRGQLGGATPSGRGAQVSVALTGVLEVAAGGSHTCARTYGGQVICWGANDRGQLGYGTTSLRATPMPPVPGLGEITQIVAGAAHSCALRADGIAFCWGSNGYGQLGVAGGQDYLTPMPPVPGLAGVLELAAGREHTCARIDGAVVCWGANDRGQLGYGTTSPRATPMPPVPGLADVAGIAAGGSHTCARTYGGQVVCWGANDHGQLGFEASGDRPLPTQAVSDLAGIAQVATGTDHTCVLLRDGTVRCWGANGYGQLGDGTNVDRFTPVQVADVSDVVRIALGARHSCALRRDRTVRCWGDDALGQVSAAPRDEDTNGDYGSP